MMPSTSVQIQSSAASSAAARIDAEKSEPPRPSVVGRPSAVAPLNPVTTGSTPFSSMRQQSRAGLLPRRLHQRRRVAEDGVGDHDLGRIDRRRGRALRFQIRRHQQRRKPLADRHRLIHRARRPLAQHAACRRRCARTRRPGRGCRAARRRAGPPAAARGTSPGGARAACGCSPPGPAVSPASAWRMVSSSRSVIFDIAETTMATGRFLADPAEIRAATRIRSAEPTLVPPNFITSRSFNREFLSIRHAGADHFENCLLHLVGRQPGGIDDRPRRAPASAALRRGCDRGGRAPASARATCSADPLGRLQISPAAPARPGRRPERSSRPRPGTPPCRCRALPSPRW